MDNEIVNCMKCEHFYVTWDKKFPKGCKLFGFKTSNLPSSTVFQATGSKCSNFTKKTIK